jgi:hypothetical protein
MILLDFVTANICVYFQYLFYAFEYAPIFYCFNLRFMIDVVVIII